MPIKFTPHFVITSKIARALMQIEACKEKIRFLPLTSSLIASLRETARLYTTHYSTMIEGNRLVPEQIKQVLKHEGHFPGRERDEHEVKGYYTALEHIEKWVLRGEKISESLIQKIHALVMSDGSTKVKSSKYRDGQNVIRDVQTKAIIYMPPEAKDVPRLMKSLVNWIKIQGDLPCPVIAAITHYQFATIHPYYDGNGRTARLLTTLILHLGGYDLKGFYSLEEYYARNLGSYYTALNIGESHNYYMGRAQADITSWIEYFIEGMADSFSRVISRMEDSQQQGKSDQSGLLKTLDPKQRKALGLFHEYEEITSKQVGELFNYQPRTSAALCAKWAVQGFLKITDSSNKGRKYMLNQKYKKLLDE